MEFTPDILAKFITMDQEFSQKKIKQKRATAKALKFFFFFLIVLILLGTSLSYQVIFSSKETPGEQVSLLETIGQLPVFKTFSRLFGASDKKLLGEDADRINLLLLGMGGGDHFGM